MVFFLGYAPFLTRPNHVLYQYNIMCSSPINFHGHNTMYTHRSNTCILFLDTYHVHNVTLYAGCLKPIHIIKLKFIFFFLLERQNSVKVQSIVNVCSLQSFSHVQVHVQYFSFLFNRNFKIKKSHMDGYILH